MKKNTNNLAITILIAVVVGAVGFYGGMQYEKSKTPVGGGNFARGGGQGGFQRQGNSTNRPVNGQIMSQDANSIVVKMRDGSSKIVNFSGTTVINKATTGTSADLKTGEQITAFGTANSDGSITAQNIAIGGGMFRGGGQGGGAPQGGSGQ